MRTTVFDGSSSAIFSSISAVISATEFSVIGNPTIVESMTVK